MGRRRETKEEYRRVLNEIFGVEIAWDRLPLADLKLLASVLASPTTRQALCERLQCECGVTPATIARAIDKLIPENLQGPLIRKLKEFLTAEETGEAPQE